MTRYFNMAALELRRYRRGHLLRAALVAIILLPLLYGTVYLVAFWNPYDNLTALPVAIVNEDKPADAQGQTIDVGQTMTNQLLSSDSFDFHLVSPEEGDAGLEDGTYYFAIRIPANFSAAVATLGTVNPTRAQLTITTNDANNYITSLISRQAGTQIQAIVEQGIIQQFVTTSLDGITKIRASLVEASNGANKLNKGAGTLTGGTGQLVGGTSELSSGSARVAAGNAQLAQVADTARGYAEDAESGVESLVKDLAKYAAAHPDDPLAQDLLAGARLLEDGVDSVVSKVVSATDKIDELSDGSSEVAAGAKKLNAGAKQLNAGAKQLRAGTAQLAAGLSSGVLQIPNWSNAENANIAGVVASPVTLNQVNQNSPGSYGGGFAPYFMAMSLWVGLLVVFMLLTPLPRRVLMSSRVGPLGATMVGYMPVLAVSIAQVVVLLAVVRFGVGVTPVYTGYLLLFLLLTSAVYATILQLLNAALGSAGRIVALVLLMLQLCSSGGTYPIETSPMFFRAISPYLPMTYVVRGMRHLIDGGPQSITLYCVGVLILFGVGALALSVVVAARQRVISISDVKPELVL